MMIKLITITFSILFLLASISFAAEDNKTNKYAEKKYEQKKKLEQNKNGSDSCESTSGLGQWECAQKKMKISDKKLNATYKVLIGMLQNGFWPNGVDPKKDLIKAQRLWIKYRDANCQLVGGISGGAPEWRSAYYENCRVEMTEERTEELQKYIDQHK